MGTHQSASLTALLLIFKAGFGRWPQDPRHAGRQRRSPSFGGLIWHELFGPTDGRSKHVRLSDGATPRTRMPTT